MTYAISEKVSQEKAYHNHLQHTNTLHSATDNASPEATSGTRQPSSSELTSNTT